ncbi:MAG TPA: DUF2264 domain-containing protein [Opitutaceae bacterium]
MAAAHQRRAPGAEQLALLPCAREPRPAPLRPRLAAGTRDSDLAQLDRFYLGNGSYSDGETTAHFRDGRLGDCYVPMAFHYYSLLYARLASADDPTQVRAHLR